MGGWAVAQSPILVTTITLDRLRKRGYMAMLTYYEKIAPHLNEPLYTRPVSASDTELLYCLILCGSQRLPAAVLCD